MSTYTIHTPPRSPHLMLAPLLGVLILLALPRPAAALDGQLWGSIGAGGAQPGSVARQWGPGAQLGLALTFHERWGAHLGAEGLYHLASEKREIPAVPVTDLFAGVRYNIDYFRYVPYLGVSAVAYLLPPPVGTPQSPGLSPTLGARLTLGLLWRPRREWSLGGHLDLSGPIPDFGLSSALWFDLGYHWRW